MSPEESRDGRVVRAFRWLRWALRHVGRLARKTTPEATPRAGLHEPKPGRRPAAERVATVDTSSEWDEIGRQCAYFAMHEPSSWISRHVETIQLMSASFARRRLTIDLRIPSSSELGFVPEDPDRPAFWIPVASVGKKPPVSNVDLRDEAGAAMPLLTREENAAISGGAIAGAAAELLEQPPSPLLSAVLQELTVRDGVEADFALGLAQAALREEGGVSTARGEAFDGALRSITGSSWLWLLLEGRPGSRRVIKFHYDIEISQPSLRPRRRTEHRYLVRATDTGTVYRFDLVEQGDGNRRSAFSRLAARVANASGFAAIDLAIETPYISGSATYHLQVDSPPAVETRGVRLLARLKPGAKLASWHRDHGVHLYLTNAKVEQMFPAVVTLRVGRRGFLTISWLTAVFIVALLWVFYAAGAGAYAHPEPAAALLLIVPVLLTAFVVRPGEHLLATRLLSGVRLLVGLNGLLAVAAAAAVTNVKPAAWSTTHAWFVYAIVASVVGGLLTISWVLSWEWTHRAAEYAQRRWRSRSFYFASCLLFAVLSTAPVTLAWAQPSALLGLEGLYIGLLVALGALSAFAAGTYARVELPSSAIAIALLAAVVSCFALAAAAVLVLHLVAEWAWESALRGLGYGLWACLLALALQELIVRLPSAQGGDK